MLVAAGLVVTSAVAAPTVPPTVPEACRAKVRLERIDCIAGSGSPDSLALLVDLMAIDRLHAAAAAGRLAARDPQPLFALAHRQHKPTAANAVQALMEMGFYLRAKSSGTETPTIRRVARLCAEAVLDPDSQLAQQALRCVAEFPSQKGIANLEQRLLTTDDPVTLYEGLGTATKLIERPSPALVERVWNVVRQPFPKEWQNHQILQVASACQALSAWNVDATQERRMAARQASAMLRPLRPQYADQCLLLAALLEKKPARPPSIVEKLRFALAKFAVAERRPPSPGLQAAPTEPAARATADQSKKPAPEKTDEEKSRAATACRESLVAPVLDRAFDPVKLAAFGKAPSRQPFAFPLVIGEGDTVASLAIEGGLSFALKTYASLGNAAFRKANPDFRRLHAGTVLWQEEHEEYLNIRFSDSPAYSRVDLTLEGVKVDAALQSDADGSLWFAIPPLIRYVAMYADFGCFKVEAGTMPNSGTLKGIQKRLSNLGYPVSASGRMDERTKSAIMRFQEDHGIHPTGKLDKKTHKTIVAAHGS